MRLKIQLTSKTTPYVTARLAQFCVPLHFTYLFFIYSFITQLQSVSTGLRQHEKRKSMFRRSCKSNFISCGCVELSIYVLTDFLVFFPRETLRRPQKIDSSFKILIELRDSKVEIANKYDQFWRKVSIDTLKACQKFLFKKSIYM